MKKKENNNEVLEVLNFGPDQKDMRGRIQRYIVPMLREMREASHYTQEGMAKMLDLSRQTILRIENGSANLTLENLCLYIYHCQPDVNKLMEKIVARNPKEDSSVRYHQFTFCIEDDNEEQLELVRSMLGTVCKMFKLMNVNVKVSESIVMAEDSGSRDSASGDSGSGDSDSGDSGSGNSGSGDSDA